MTDLQLDTLEAKGLIRLAAFQPELEYLFRHALIQDTAYESLLKQERRALHRLVGEALEELYPERRGDLAAVLAMHFEQAGDTDRAINYLMEAARFAYERNAISEAYELYGRAAALLPPPSDADDQQTLRRRVGVELGRVKAGFSFITESEALAIIEPRVADAERLDDKRLTADVHLTIAVLHEFRGDRPEIDEVLRRSLERVSEIAAELRDPLLAALPQSLVGLFQVFTGHLREGIETLRAAAPMLEQKRDFVGSSFALVALAIGYARLGQFDKADEAAQRASQVAADGDVIAKIDALIGESTVRSVRGDLEAAVPLAMKCTNLAEESGATACVVASNFVLGDAYMRQQKFEAAQIAFERGNEVANTIEQKQFRPSIAAYMRSNAASLGNFGPNTRTFEEALAETRKLGDLWGEANVTWKRAETEAKKTADARDVAEMLADYSAAADAFERMGGRPYLARVLRDWGTALRQVDRREEAAEKYRRALSLFEQIGIEREADELRRMLREESPA